MHSLMFFLAIVRVLLLEKYSVSTWFYCAFASHDLPCRQADEKSMNNSTQQKNPNPDLQRFGFLKFGKLNETLLWINSP